MEKQVNIVLVDDHQLIIDGINSLLVDIGYKVVGSAQNVRDAQIIIDEKDPDIVICDIHMPYQRGTDLVRWIKEHKPWIKVIVLSMCDDRTTISEVVAMGINAYLLKSQSIQNLQTAIERTLAGRFFISEEIADVLMAKVDGDITRRMLTCREEEILRLILDELSNREIADKLFISERTVEAHRRNIYRKTSTTSIIGLMKWAVENNVVVL
ncbi:MAG: response regulator transcription factor [Tenuifilaceae bacterium]|jgi:DNA-binding NarL/FixJ family response regulator|nr:response regulator transcription factor [Tenuifilaceae bacterium]